MLRKLAVKFLGEKFVATIDYRRGIRHKENWEGVFNKQDQRKQIFDEITETFNPDLLVETGTFRGTTTEYIARSTQAEVITIEANPYNAGYAAARLKPLGVRLIHADSRTGLRSVMEKQKIAGQRVFFYLDAHWEKDLPLREEVQLIFGESGTTSIIMIDDFCVSDDAGYHYDNYGENGSLTLEYIADILDKYDAKAFFPIVSSSEETGAKRGCVILGKDQNVISALSSCNSIREFSLTSISRKIKA